MKKLITLLAIIWIPVLAMGQVMDDTDTISNAESGSSIRAKHNADILKGNALADSVTTHGDSIRAIQEDVTTNADSALAVQTDLATHEADGTNPHLVVASQLSLGNVENTALSTWAGTSSITTLGIIGTGLWNGTAIANSYLATVLTGKTYNGVSLSAAGSASTYLNGAGSYAKPDSVWGGITVNGNIAVTGTVDGKDVSTLGTGNVSKVGTPVIARLGVWTGDGTLGHYNDLWFETGGALYMGEPGTMTTSFRTNGTINQSVLDQAVSNGITVYSNTATIAGNNNVNRYGGVYNTEIAAPTNAQMVSNIYKLYDGTSLLEGAQVEIGVDGAVATDNFSTYMDWYVRETTGSSDTVLRLGVNGLEYYADHSTDQAANGLWLPSKDYVDNAIAAAVAGGDSHDSVTFTGSPDYITIGDNQVVTVGDVDLTADVTGTLPVANGGTALTSLSTLLNSNTTKSDVSLGSVENTALSTWVGTSSLTTLGTIGTGLWNGTAIANSYLATTLTGKTYNGVSLTTGGAATDYLNAAGNYTTPAGGGGDSHDSVTLTGTPDYVSIGDNQVITVAQVDLAADVTGSLPVANGGTALTSLSTLLNSNTTKSDVSLGSVENTALSTWAGTSSLTTLGTIGTGLWNGTAIANSYLATTLTGKTYNGVTLTTGGAATDYLNAEGNYTTPAGGGGSTELSTGTVTATTYGITSDGGTDDVVLPEADTDNAGLLGADKYDEIVENTAKVGVGDTSAIGEVAILLVDERLKIPWNFTDSSQFHTDRWMAWFWWAGPDTLAIVGSRAGCIGGSPNFEYNLCFNDSLDFSGDYTKCWTTDLVVTGTDCTTVGEVDTSPNNASIPPNNWVMLKSDSQTVKPTYGCSFNVYGYEY